MPNIDTVWNACPISEDIREDMNIGLASAKLGLELIVYPDGTTHYDDMSNLFNVGNETVRRWYGYQENAVNRCIPKQAEGYRIVEIRRGMVQHSGNRPPLSGELVDNLRLRCFLASMSGINHNGQGMGLSRDSLWSGKVRELEKEYRTCSEALSAWDDYYFNRGGGREGAYIYHAWEKVYLYWDAADEVWRLSMHCRDKAMVPGDGGANGPIGSISDEQYDEEEDFTDEEGNLSYEDLPDDEDEDDPDDNDEDA